MLEAAQVEVNIVICRCFENSFLASSTCLFASNGGLWGRLLCGEWEMRWAEGRRGKRGGRAGGTYPLPWTFAHLVVTFPSVSGDRDSAANVFHFLCPSQVWRFPLCGAWWDAEPASHCRRRKRQTLAVGSELCSPLKDVLTSQAPELCTGLYLENSFWQLS